MVGGPLWALTVDGPAPRHVGAEPPLHVPFIHLRRDRSGNKARAEARPEAAPEPAPGPAGGLAPGLAVNLRSVPIDKPPPPWTADR